MRRPSSSAEARRTRRRLAVAAALALAAAGPASLPQLQWAHRVGIDLLLPWQRRFLPATGREPLVAVVAIDEETYASPEFSGRPQVTWTPQLAAAIAAVDAAGPRVMGLDLIYPTTLDQPGLLPGYDRPLLKALHDAGRGGRMVLGMARLSRHAIEPERRQLLAVGGADNLRPVNLLLDPDEVVRRAAVSLPGEDGDAVPTFDGEIARRAGLAPPAGDFTIDMRADPTPVYGLADLKACAEAGNAAFFERFRDKIILFGTTLDIEDRFETSARLTPALTAIRHGERCMPAADSDGGVEMNRGTMPGVLIHAKALETIAAGSAPTVLRGPAAGLAVWIWTFVLTLAVFPLRPAIGAAAGVVALGAAFAAAVAVFAAFGVVLPVVVMAPAAGLAFAGTFAFRYMVEDAAKRRVEHAFRHYLAPTLVDQLGENPEMLRLGGEARQVTVFFSDIAGFTTISEKLADRPDILVALMNRYLSMMTRIVQAHGGYVDKYIGDAVMAIWGVPIADDGAGRHCAVEAAMACMAELERFNRDVVGPEFGMPPMGTRIGINTGIAVAGNMGSTDRFNYTVVGDTVNLAARLEGANKPFGTGIMIGADTRAGLPDDFVVRRLDLLVVKGKNEPVAVFEPFGPAAGVSVAALERIAAFDSAWDLHRARRFADALAAFEALADIDPPAATYAERCRHYLNDPPPADWDGRYVLKEK